MRAHPRDRGPAETGATGGRKSRSPCRAPDSHDTRPYRPGQGLFKAATQETVAGGGRLKAIIPITYRTTVARVLASMAMLTHNQIWTAIDRLAARAKLTPSGLAKKAGLDPTTFNKSKRVTPEGR